jgi:hypothetical protein
VATPGRPVFYKEIVMALNIDYIPTAHGISAIEDRSYYSDVQCFLPTRCYWSKLNEETRKFIEQQIPYFAKTIAHFNRDLKEEYISQRIRSWL